MCICSQFLSFQTRSFNEISQKWEKCYEQFLLHLPLSSHLINFHCRGLKGLAFLDLAQNNIRILEPGILRALDSLTALNLERNVIQKLHKAVFDGVNDTLSSLSLLNNLLTEFPLEAIRSLSELRVSQTVCFFACQLSLQQECSSKLPSC